LYASGSDPDCSTEKAVAMTTSSAAIEATSEEA